MTARLTLGPAPEAVASRALIFTGLPRVLRRHKAVAFTAEEFHYAFANTLSAEESKAAWQRYAIAAPGNWVWVYGLIANYKPGHQETWVDYDQDRAPLLFIAGEKDHIMPPAVNKSNASRYKHSPARTEYHEFEGKRPLDLRRPRVGGGRGLRARLGRETRGYDRADLTAGIVRGLAAR